MADKEKKKEPILIQYIKDRIFKKNKNFFMIVVGATGSGKSYSALRLAELLDNTFNIDRCSFKAKDFMQQINSLVNSDKEIKGKVVMWDELGVEHSAREFMTVSNRVINYFFQTSRNLNLIVIMTVPLLSFIDSNTRKLAHCIAETQGINQRTKQVTLKIKMLQTNVMTGKEYPKYLRYKKKNKLYVIKKIKVGMPSKEIREPYEVKKLEFNKELNSKIMNKLDRVEQSDMKRTKPLTEYQEKFVELLSKYDINKTCRLLRISKGTAYTYKRRLEDKGVVFKPIREDNKVIRYKVEGFSCNSDENPNEPPV